jgi:hypothetical protein
VVGLECADAYHRHMGNVEFVGGMLHLGLKQSYSISCVSDGDTTSREWHAEGF